MGEPIRAAIRIRPLLPQEAVESVVVTVEPERAAVTVRPPTPATPQRYSADWVFCDTEEPIPGAGHAAASSSQARVYSEIGAGLLAEAIRGCNCILIAYGASGSGKSHSILGYGDEPGLIPRTTAELFQLIEATELDLCVWCSYLEIQQERLKDLLCPDDQGTQVPELASYELPSGMCIPRLTEVAVHSIADVQHLVDFGNRRRAAAATLLSSASRSHTVFEFHLEGRLADGMRGPRSRLTLIDCAGSGQRHRDPSLHTLQGLVTQFADGPEPAALFKRHNALFRQSRLTHLLKGGLVGSSRMIVLATVSPCSSNVAETLNTLGFAAAARRACRLPQSGGLSRSEDPQLEMDALKELVFPASPGEPLEVEELEEIRAALQDRSKRRFQPRSLQRKLAKELRAAQEKLLCRCGLLPSTEEIRGPYLVNINGDPMLTGCLVYPLKRGKRNTIGSAPSNGIVLQGLGIADRHCWIEDTINLGWRINVLAGGPRVLVNGELQSSCRQLRDGDRLMLGWAHALRVVIPCASSRKSWEINDLRLEDCLREVERGPPGEALLGASSSLEEARQRFGRELGEKLEGELRIVCPLVDEANELTRALRPSDNLFFDVVACPAVLDDNKTVLKTSEQNVKDLVIIRILRKASADASVHQVVDLCTTVQFLDRLESIRDIYQEITRPASLPSSRNCNESWEEDPLLDAWGDPNLAEIWNRASEGVALMLEAAELELPSQPGGNTETVQDEEFTPFAPPAEEPQVETLAQPVETCSTSAALSSGDNGHEQDLITGSSTSVEVTQTEMTEYSESITDTRSSVGCGDRVDSSRFSSWVGGSSAHAGSARIRDPGPGFKRGTGIDSDEDASGTDGSSTIGRLESENAQLQRNLLALEEELRHKNQMLEAAFPGFSIQSSREDLISKIDAAAGHKQGEDIQVEDSLVAGALPLVSSSACIPILPSRTFETPTLQPEYIAAATTEPYACVVPMSTMGGGNGTTTPPSHTRTAGVATPNSAPSIGATTPKSPLSMSRADRATTPKSPLSMGRADRATTPTSSSAIGPPPVVEHHGWGPFLPFVDPTIPSPCTVRAPPQSPASVVKTRSFS